MVKFKMEDDDAKGGGIVGVPRSSKPGAARTEGGGTKYNIQGDGGKSSSDKSGLGHNGKTSGPAGTRIKGFSGAPRGYSRSLPYARDQSNPMKR